MAISYPLSWPTEIPVATMTLRRVDAVALAEAPTSFGQQVQHHGGARWEADIAVGPLDNVDARILGSFFAALRGRYGFFNMPIWGRETLRGVGGGTPVVDAGAASGDLVVPVANLPASTTGVWKAGDLISISGVVGGYSPVHEITADVDSDGSGLATVDIWPPLRRSHPISTSIVTSNCEGSFRLVEPATERLSGPISRFEFRVHEALTR